MPSLVEHQIHQNIIFTSNRCIGVRAKKYLGCEGFFPEFPPTCPKDLCATFAYKFSSKNIMKSLFCCDLQKKSQCVFLQT